MGKVRRTLGSLLLVSMLVASMVTGIVAGTAGAAITPRTEAAGALAISQALAGSANVTGASYATTTAGTPNGTSDSALAGFPTDGSTFGILTSGDVSTVPNANTFTSTSNAGPAVRGDTDFDVSVLKTDVSVPSGANCLTFDFKFLSEEYPGFVGSSYNDAFIAELDASNWTTAGSAITAPNNFAFDGGGQVVSINSTGIGGMSAAEGAGTAFDGIVDTAGAGTALLHASRQVTPGAHSVYFSIFDQGDHGYDSAVFLDNLTVGFVPNPAENCVAGATPVTANLDLTPATATSAVGTSHTVTATLTNGSATPTPGAPLSFTVTGANPTTGTATTNASGVATFSYTGTNVGTDQISACYDSDATAPCEAVASVTKEWTAVVPTTFPLNVSVSGSGTGSVTSTPAGISCPSTCSAAFTSGSSVSLTPTPASGSVFTGWTGACTGTGACSVTMSAAQSVTAGFDAVGPTTNTLSVTTTGSGSVVSDPAGITCPSTCSTEVADGGSVALTATPTEGWTFTGWSGACSGTGACTVTVNADTAVGATFTVIPTGEGNLTVTETVQPPTVTSGSSAQHTFTVTNTGDAAETNVQLVISFPAGSTVTSTDPDQGTCTVAAASVTCSLGTIGAGENVQIPVIVRVPAGFTGPFVPTATSSSDQSEPTEAPALPGSETVPPGAGQAFGYVPPGGTITTGDATAANPTAGTFTLPNTGAGAPITLTTEDAPPTFCGGQPCRGKLLTLSTFEGYSDPNRAPVLDISLDRSVVRQYGPSWNVWVQKEDPNVAPYKVPSCQVKTYWTKWKHHSHGHHGYWHWHWHWHWQKHTKKIAVPSPCVASRYIDRHGDSHVKLLVLSGDPKFARR